MEIFIPFWGDPALLYRTVDSVKAQHRQDWTVTIVDDCYPDPSVAEHFAHETDPRITYIRNEVNLGITENYQRCKDLATGELMMFMGCDDVMHPSFLDVIHAAHAQFPQAAVIQVGVQVIDENDQVIDPLTDKIKRAIMPRVGDTTELSGEPLAVSLLRGDWLYWPSLVFRTEQIRAYPFRDGLPIIQDLALMIDMIEGGESMVIAPQVCFSYRRHSGSASSTSLIGGRRFTDERHYYASAADQMRRKGWRRAQRTASIRWTSRAHSLTLLPSALKARRWDAIGSLLNHTFHP